VAESEPNSQSSLELPDHAVKAPKTLHKISSDGAAGGPRFVRLLEGWELGAITVGMVLSAALLAVPRTAAPGLFPVPLVDVAEARVARARRAELVARAEHAGLPFETRAVGDAVRRFGLALSGSGEEGEHLERVLAERVALAFGAGQQQQLLQLRAVQARLFVQAVREHRFGEPVGRELRALGGDFVERALRNGWAGPAGCLASDDELATLFELRWLELVRLRDAPSFKPTLGDLRRYYRFLLLHPERSTGSDGPAVGRARLRLRYVEALGRRDTEYPLALARGSLLGELGMLPGSAAALREHLAEPGRATWNLRARNYLLYAAKGQADFSAELTPLDAP
jgi:hypothetical protein